MEVATNEVEVSIVQTNQGLYKEPTWNNISYCGTLGENLLNLEGVIQDRVKLLQRSVSYIVYIQREDSTIYFLIFHIILNLVIMLKTL